jgi:FkbM family methyltransferase
MIPNSKNPISLFRKRREGYKYIASTVRRKFSDVSVGDRAVLHEIHGLNFLQPVASAIGQLLLLGDFEKNDVEWVQSILREGDVFVDVGANHGLYSLVAAKELASTGPSVVAFEPNPKARAIFELNLKLNGLDQEVQLRNEAVCENSGTISFLVAKDTAMSGIRKNSHRSQELESWIDVQSVTLDEVLTDLQKLRPVSRFVIKIDVEGAEGLVLEGLSEHKNTDLVMLVEFCDVTLSGYGLNGKELYNRFVQRGFELFELEGHALVKAKPKDTYSVSNIVAIRGADRERS